MENKNKFIQVADSIYEEFIEEYRRTHSGVVEFSYNVAIIKFFHLLIYTLVFYLDILEAKG